MSKKKILVVEDEQDCREGLAKILTREGYEVVTAESGEDALMEVKRQDFDLIITDLIMPGISGIDVLKKVHAQNPDIPVIIVTGYGVVTHYFEAMALGAFEYFLKPFRLDELRRVVSKALTFNGEDVIHHERSNSVSGKKQKIYDILSKGRITNNKNQKVKMSMEDLDTFKAVLSTIAHSLKGEFTNIGGSLGEIKELCKESSELGEECAIIERSIMYIQILLRRMLDYLDIGTPPIEEIDTLEVFKKTEMIALARLPSNIKFQTSIDHSLNNKKVLGNTDQLMWVLLELINNSANTLRNKPGKIELSLGYENDNIIISIKDNGPGIPEDIKNDIFKKKLPSKSSTGVGLFLSFKVIKGLGGELILMKSPEKGTIFTILMPIIGEE